MNSQSIRDVWRGRRPCWAVLLLLVLLPLVVTGTEAAPGQWAATGDMNVARYGHTATLLRDGRVLVVGGLSGGAALAGAELYDPATGTWTLTGSLHTGRSRHAAALLPDGRVLVAGGYGGGAPLASVEIYDPAKGSWSRAASMQDARYDFGSAALLLDGRVLVAGGMGASGVLASTELYDPQTDAWTLAEPLRLSRAKHTTTLLTYGHVLLTGGTDGSSLVNRPERYDPFGSDSYSYWSPEVLRAAHEAVLLADGRVLLSGGNNGAGTVNTAQVFVPVGEEPRHFSYETEDMNEARENHTATLLRNGQVLVTGGFNGKTLAGVELYEPLTNSWYPAAPMAAARRGHTATLLPDNRVLVAGGRSGSGALRSAELYETIPENWMLTTEMSVSRGGHEAVLLPDGRVMVFRSYVYDFREHTYHPGPAEIFDPVEQTWSEAPSSNFPHLGRSIVLLDGRILLAGLVEWGETANSAELFDPATNKWTMTGDMKVPRSPDNAVRLQDGRVLVMGGGPSDTPDEWSAEIYDPAAGTWSLTSPMNAAYGASSVLLADGRVLVTGGSAYAWCGSPQKSVQLYDPATGNWTSSGEMTDGRRDHTSILLPDGRVLVFGGYDPENWHCDEMGPSAIGSAELYDPLTETWTVTGAMGEERAESKAVLLPDGRVLAVGGEAGWFGEVGSTELYDPADGLWRDAGNMAAERAGHTATLLPDGRVLVIGGYSSFQHDDGYSFRSVELYDPLPCPVLPGNIAQNACFSEGTAPWQLYSNGWGRLDLGSPGYNSEYAARIEIGSSGSNVQFYQAGLPLEPDQHYRLQFAAKSSNGQDASLFVHKHGAPYSNYGLRDEVVNLTTSWKQFTIDFTTNSRAQADGRLRFWLAPYDTTGTVYWFDDIYLLKVTDGSAGPPPDPDPPAVNVPPSGHCSVPVAGNALLNPGFEAGDTAPWAFYSDGLGVVSPDTSTAYECAQAGKVTIEKAGHNVQLYQAGLALQPDTAYQLRLAAKSSDGRDVFLYLHKHAPPYTNYGLNGIKLNLTREWQVFVVQFTTGNFSGPVADGRLRLDLADSDAANASYSFDDVILVPLETGATSTATSAASSKPLISGYFMDDEKDGQARGRFVPRLTKGTTRCSGARASKPALWSDAYTETVKIMGIGKPRVLRVTGIWQDEPVHPQPSGFINSQLASLMPDPDREGNGRVYHVTFWALYRDGTSCEHEVLVKVPYQTTVDEVIDDGPLADSTMGESRLAGD